MKELDDPSPAPRQSAGPRAGTVHRGRITSDAEAAAILEHEARQQLDELAQSGFPGIACTTHIAWGSDPARSILAAAEELDVDAIVMATHDRTGISGMIVTSVARAVLREAKCLVLLAGPNVK
jgi:nucleotide-binding universal stress UspA family protein